MSREARAQRDIGMIRAWFLNKDPLPAPPDLAVYLELEVALRELEHYGMIRWSPDHAGALALLKAERLPGRRPRV